MTPSAMEQIKIRNKKKIATKEQGGASPLEERHPNHIVAASPSQLSDAASITVEQRHERFPHDSLSQSTLCGSCTRHCAVRTSTKSGRVEKVGMDGERERERD